MHKRFGIFEILSIGLREDVKKSIMIYSGLMCFSIFYQIFVFYIGFKIPEFYTVLQQKSFDDFKTLLLILLALIMGASFCKSGMEWTAGMFSLMLRRSLTLHLHSSLLRNLLDLSFVDLDNPDQRITQDVEKFTFLIGYILEKVIISPLLMIYYTFRLVQDDGWSAPTCLFLFFIISMVISKIVINPIAKIVSKKEQKEGDLRFVHLRLLNSVDPVTFSSSQSVEKNVLDSKLHDLLIYQKYLVYTQMIISFLTGTLDYLGTLMSYTIVAIPIFMGSVEPDATIIGKNLFISFYLLNVFTSIVDLADKFAEVNGYGSRIGHLLSVFDDFTLKVGHNCSSIDSKDVNWGVFNLSFGAHMNSMKPLISNLSFELKKGSHIIISGSSGCGKTTLLKVLKGFWPPISGQIMLPQDICFLQSDPYFLYDGSIRDQITYPESGDLLSESDYRQIISDCELESIMELYYDFRATHVSGDWTLKLSSGERQRLAFCRLLWRKPSFAFLDEATVHMGTNLSKKLFSKGMERGITFVILTHENLVSIFPNHKLILLDQKVNHISFL